MNDPKDYLEILLGEEIPQILYKKTTKGQVQQWQIERLNEKYRVIYGKVDGKLIISEWTIATSTNIGRTNERSPTSQAIFEVEALYKKKLEQEGYFRNIKDIEKKLFIKPMLANAFDPKRVSYPCSLQPKLDGMRCIMTKDGCFSRKGKYIPAAQFIRDSAEFLFEENPELILDGEIYNHELKNDFQTLMSIVKKQKLTDEDLNKCKQYLQFHVYDVVSNESWISREDFLSFVLGIDNQVRQFSSKFIPSRFSPYITTVFTAYCANQRQIDDWVLEFLEEDYEGGMIRLNNLPYENKRTYQLMKYKNFQDREWELADIEEGKGNWAGHAKRAILWKDDANKSLGICKETTFAAGIAGSKEYTKRLLEEKSSAIGKPTTITFFRFTDDGIPYLPIMKIVRDYE